MEQDVKAPRSRTELLEQLAAIQPLPAQLAQIAKFALENGYLMAFGSCASIANSAGVSPTTVSRLVTALGFHGFREFRYVFQSELRRAANHLENIDARECNQVDRFTLQISRTSGCRHYALSD